MTTYYVGSGGNDANDGLSWANRKLTLNGAEDIPVSAGDTVYVGPGVYRETLTVDVSGSSGSPITYIGDVTGEHTDGVGGVVRITGSDNDQTATRDYCITATSKEYRTFRSLSLDTTANHIINLITSTTSFIIEYCSINGTVESCSGVYFGGATQSSNIVRNCYIINCGRGVYFYNDADVSNTSQRVENSIIISCGIGIRDYNVGGIVVNNCIVIGCHVYGIAIDVAPAEGQTLTVNNSIVTGCGYGLRSVSAGYLIDDYNSCIYNGNDRINVTKGNNSKDYNPLFEHPVLKEGIVFPWNPFALSKWSQIARIAGTTEQANDLYGITRPTTSAKKSWGAIQYIPGEREVTTKYTGSASIKLADAGVHQLFVATNNTEITVSVYCYTEADYSGTQPQMIIKQPGQSDITVTRTGDHELWTELTDTFTPAASPEYIVVELRNNNEATSGSYAVYFDTLSVS